MILPFPAKSSVVSIPLALLTYSFAFWGLALMTLIVRGWISCLVYVILAIWWSRRAIWQAQIFTKKDKQILIQNLLGSYQLQYGICLILSRTISRGTFSHSYQIELIGKNQLGLFAQILVDQYSSVTLAQSAGKRIAKSLTLPYRELFR